MASGAAPETKRRTAVADTAISLVRASGAVLFCDQHGEAFIAFNNKRRRREVWPLKSKAAGDYVRLLFF